MTMVATHPPLAGRVSFQGLRRAATTSILALVFLVVFVVILLLISALNLQHSVTASVDDAVTATIGQVRLDVRTLNALDWRENQADQEIADLKRQMADYDSRMDVVIENVSITIRKNAAQNPQIPSALTALPNVEDPHENAARLTDRLELYKNKIKADADKAVVTDDMISRYLAQLQMDLLPTIKTYLPLRDKWRDLERQIKAIEEEKAALMAPPKDIATNRLANESYRTVVEDFRTFQAIVGDKLFGVVLLPNPVLVLLLSIFMGMLGSLIHLSRRLVIEGQDIDVSEMFYRIGLGAAVALALFFFAAAGMLTLSQSSSGKIDTNMSPYLIAFLGITAGFLSERTTAWMKEVGERAFKLESGPGRARWATGLAGEMTRQEQSSGALASAIGLKPGNVDSYARLEVETPCREQSLIAAYLRVHPSMLFTDLDPKTTEES
jgi:hypothetical protein